MLYIATGGTIDKQPSFLPDGSFDHDSKCFSETQLPAILDKANLMDPYSVQTLFMIDSLDMTDAHRDTISDAIEDNDEMKVVITHGTDTMPETARHLQRNNYLAQKTIVLTGAMIPFCMGEQSDATFNVAFATGAARLLPKGIYVAMNGIAFAANNVRKDKEAGVFRRIREPGQR